MKNKSHVDGNRKPPEWKKIIALVLIVAMPLLFYYSKSSMTQRALNTTTETPAKSVNK